MPGLQNDELDICLRVQMRDNWDPGGIGWFAIGSIPKKSLVIEYCAGAKEVLLNHYINVNINNPVKETYERI